MSVPDPASPAVFLMGPTAAGKTELAVQLCERLPLEIISVDSALVYRGLDVGAAKPDAQTLRRAPHRLIDIRDPADPYSAADFRADALAAMAEITRAGRIPLLVGGTMLYFRALEHGLAELPEADPQRRARLEREAAAQGWPALHARLARIDPAAAARVHPNDPQRIQRALEVYELTGRPWSEHWQSQPMAPLPYRLIKLAVAPSDRGELHRRIALRLRHMLDQGLVAEVRRLYDRGDLAPALPAVRAVGYRQVWAYLAGETDYDRMVERAIVATRRLAKRQLTWLRADPDAVWFDSLAGDTAARVLTFLEGELGAR